MLELLRLQRILWTFGLFVYFCGSDYAHPLSEKGSMNGKRKARETNTLQHIIEESTTQIDCDVKELTGFSARTVNVTWFHNGTEITDENHFKMKPKSKALYIKKVTATDAGVFGCRISTPGGVFWKNTTLMLTPEDVGRIPAVPQMICPVRVLDTAESPPKFTFSEGTPDFHEATFVKLVKEPLSLPCCATGNSSVLWEVNGIPLVITPTGLGTFQELPDGSLFFAELTHTDSGHYTCNRENAHGKVSFKYEIKVEPRPTSDKPTIESDYPGNKDVFVGDRVEFRCKTSSSTNFVMEWGKNGSFFDANGTESDHQVLTKEMDPRYKMGAATFTLDNVTHEDAGQYYCIAKNGYGHDVHYGRLTVLEKPEPTTPADGPDVIPHHTGTNHLLYIGLGAGLCIFVLVFLGALFFYKQRKAHELAKKLQRPEVIPVHHIITPRRKIKITRRSSDRSEDSLLPRFCYEATIMPMDTESIVTSRATTISHCNSTIEYVCDFPVDQEWEFPREQLSFSGEGYGEELGKGAFGKVVKARAANIRGRPGISDVAVKMPKEPQSEDDEVSVITGLIEELEIMKSMDHPNVIRLLGCCSQLSEGPLFVIMEYAPYGNLKDFLRNYKRSRIQNMDYEQPIGMLELTNRNLVTYAAQIASGALYLAEKKFVHRDLAARNVLVTENYVMKLADFGLSKDLWNQDYYRKTTKGLLPVKWMAPESFDENKYTTQSDVWSFGVLLWEIWSFGDTPYGDKIPLERLIVNIRAGTRLGKPEGCSPEIYRMMDNCWKIDPSDRPSYHSILRDLKWMLQQEYLEVASPEPTPFHVENPQYMYQLGMTSSEVRSAILPVEL